MRDQKHSLELRWLRVFSVVQPVSKFSIKNCSIESVYPHFEMAGAKQRLSSVLSHLNPTTPSSGRAALLQKNPDDIVGRSPSLILDHH